MLTSFIQHASAADYQLLAPIPQLVKSGATTDFQTYLPALVKLIIGLAGAFAVVRIIMGGIQYMSTDAFSGKSEAKGTITNALIGLLLAMSAWVILYTVNPKLVNIGISLQGVGSTNQIGTALGETLTSCTPTKPCTDGRAVACTNAADCSPSSVKVCSETDPCKGGVLLCEDCVVVNNNTGNFPHKPLAEACLPPFPCMVEQALLSKIQEVQDELGKSNIGKGLKFVVTEMYPPAAVHSSDCHKNTSKAGKCVDAALRTGNDQPVTATNDADAGAKIVAFSAILQGVGLTSFQWEVKNQTEVDMWKSNINKWFEDNKNTQKAKSLEPYKNSVLGRIVPNDCPTCTLHVHINSPSIAQ